MKIFSVREVLRIFKERFWSWKAIKENGINCAVKKLQFEGIRLRGEDDDDEERLMTLHLEFC